MKIALFDNNPVFQKHLNDHFKLDVTLVNDSFVQKAQNDIKPIVIPKIFSIDKDKYDAVILNIDNYYADNILEYQSLDIIFWLRLSLDFGKPIVLTGFQNILQILKQKPNYTVINAEGIFYLDILSDFSYLDVIKKKEIDFDKEQIRKLYLQHAKNVVDLESIRHQEANWWGIKTLWDCHYAVTKGRFKEKYPSVIYDKSKELNNLLYSYIYKTTKERLSELVTYQESDFIDDSKVLLSQLNSLLIKVEEKKSELNDYNKFRAIIEKDINDLNGFMPLLKRYDTNEYREDLIENNLKLELYKTKISNLINNIDTYKKNIDLLEKLESKNKQPSKLIPLLKKFSIVNIEIKAKPKIMLIDDQASDGWKDIYQYLIYDKNVGNEFIALNTNVNVKDIVNNALEIIRQGKTDLILLDLKLKPKLDSNISNDFKNISGIEVLSKLKEKHPHLPIIVTSASNKIWTYKKIVELGADAYWLKDGIDNYFNAQQSLDNYLNLKSSIAVLLNDEFKLANKTSKRFELLLEKEDQWWLCKTWDSFTITNKKGNNTITIAESKVITPVKQVRAILFDSLTFYQNFITNKYIHSTIPSDSSWFYYSSLINHLSKIIEKIHGIDKNLFDKVKSVSKVLRSREDYHGNRLYKKRNDASHFEKAKEIDYEFFHKFMNEMANYLEK